MCKHYMHLAPLNVFLKVLQYIHIGYIQAKHMEENQVSTRPVNIMYTFTMPLMQTGRGRRGRVVAVLPYTVRYEHLLLAPLSGPQSEHTVWLPLHVPPPPRAAWLR